MITKINLKINIGLTLAYNGKGNSSILVLYCVWRGEFYFGAETSRPAWVRDEAGEITGGQATKGLSATLGHVDFIWLAGGSHCWVLSKRMT